MWNKHTVLYQQTNCRPTKLRFEQQSCTARVQTSNFLLKSIGLCVFWYHKIGNLPEAIVSPMFTRKRVKYTERHTVK